MRTLGIHFIWTTYMTWPPGDARGHWSPLFDFYGHLVATGHRLNLPDLTTFEYASRGGVTTHMFANALNADPDLRKIPVNLIAVDPVPGTGGFQLHRTSIPANVRNYVAFYARDERSMGFAATLPSIADGVNAELYAMPGRHATLVGNAGNYVGGNGTNVFFSPGKVVRMLSENYLTSWGTDLRGCLPYSEMEMLRCYDQMLGQDQQFQALSKTVYTTQRGQMDDRDIGVGQDWTSTKLKSVKQFGKNGPFINWHHGELFRKFGGAGGEAVKYTRLAIKKYIRAQQQSAKARYGMIALAGHGMGW